MGPEERRLLEETVELSRENNRILRGMRRSMRWNRLFAALKWLIIIGATVGLYYYLQPYLDSLFKSYGALLGGLENVRSAAQSLPASWAEILKNLSPR